ncbi:uncharacterized protein BO97DRAFT_408946 [Aspergillus homomorphus CBS 101889]|uniref:Serine/threonine-protein kinase ppk6 n=1 Tax=Aspergillus homomorphus (strain CBS 101889) TaxID=1450537 RepID=A0A395HJX2_ASPHC|nr:hypothetical protein BO97DRAFT_408946 [Aspergillus homomorphus CBS 101889]RAL07495.1 hypothetical protein BO97DRAFT_408946 [Aspergillus homomorphus CBS 101889]
MSADLFAEFGIGTKPSEQPQRAVNQRSTKQQTSLVPDLDSFDDSPSTPSTPFPNYANKSTAVGNQWQSSYWDKPPISGPVQQDSGNDVLFDASLETASYDESDDWGEFETAGVPTQRAPVEQSKSRGSTSEAQQTKVQESFDLLESLSLDDKPPVSGKESIGTQQKTRPQPVRKELPSTAPSLPVEDDPFEDWGDFVDGPATASSQRQDQKPPASARTQRGSVQSRAGNPHTTTTAVDPAVRFTAPSPSITADQVRPTNIPPPSVLLELFPRLFEQVRQEATDARKDMQQRDKVEHAAQLIQNTLKTAARVVVGRTLRWKRDNILSQSMRIGPAGKPGGMKLSTVNKNEDIKEQQEAVDVLTMWRDRAALFNSVVQASGIRPVPIVQENVRAMTLSADRGALKASHACALCGLKRDERLPKVDENVEDSFGEWWAEHWGHTDCRQFWENNKALLGQR